MPNIDTYLQNIKSAVYGEEVRGSIHDALEVMNDNIDASEQQQLRLSIAPIWDQANAYSKGDYVWYPTTMGTLYKANNDVAAGTAWSTANWKTETLVNGFNEVNDLKSAISGESIQLTKGYYIDTSVDVTDYSHVTNNTYRNAVVDCQPGDRFTINGRGGGAAAKLWAFAKSDGTWAQRSSNSVQGPVYLTAPEGAVKLIINSTVTIDSYPYWTPYTKTTDARIKNIEDIELAKKLELSNIGCQKIAFTGVGYIDTHLVSTDYTVVENSGYHYAIVDCSDGDLFSISGNGTNVARLWAFVDATGNIIYRVPGAKSTGLNQYEYIIAPKNAVKLIINSANNYVSYIGWYTVNDGEKKTNEMLFDYTGVRQLAFDGSGYIDVSGATTNFTPTASTAYRYTITDCVPGDRFYVKGSGMLALLWAFTDANGNIIERSTVKAKDEIITAPNGAAKMIANFSSSIDYFFAGYPQGITTAQKPGTYMEESFENDMHSQAGEIKGLLCIKNGVHSPSNYGKDNVKYRIPVKRYHKLHVCFDYQYTEKFEYIQKGYAGIFTAHNEGITVDNFYDEILSDHGYVRRRFEFGYSYGSSRSRLDRLAHYFWKPYNGKNAFYIKYNGSESGIVAIQHSAGALSLVSVNGSTVTNIKTIATYQDADSVQSLIDEINLDSDFECGCVEAENHTCDELIFSEEGLIYLTYSVTLTGESTAVIDNPKVYIPYTYDDNWHNCELLIDEDEMTAFISIDGHGKQVTLIARDLTDDDSYIEIGGLFNGSETKMRVRDLHVDIDSFGDAEIVRGNPIADGDDPVPQLISNRNPKIIIYEGHGITVGRDEPLPNNPTSEDEMAASTERIALMIRTLKSKGYKNITYQDLIDWKIDGKRLPKRCFLFMMDDYRIENYVDYDKRKPFVDENVTVGLAVVTDLYPQSETFSINGKEYTRDECFKMINRAGWFACSHTRNHRTITATLPSASDTEFKQDVLSANDLDVNSDVVVYPRGYYDGNYYNSINTSCFKIGIITVRASYICQARNNYYLSRYEMGARKPISEILQEIV